MEHILNGAPVAQALQAQTAEMVGCLKEKGISPRLALVRIGEQPASVSYERGIRKGCETAGIEVGLTALPETVSQAEAEEALRRLSEDPAVHGILLFEPLPRSLNDAALRNAIAPEKDMDCAADLSMAGVYSGKALGFPPATPQAVMELLHYYKIPLEGKNATVIGRSLVVGKPLAMLLLSENATVTVCHSKTADLAAHTRAADIVIAAMGRQEALKGEMLGEGQVVIDVGIHRSEDGRLCGDVAFEEAEKKAAAITPVPGGVGRITTAVLLRHVALAAQKAAGN
ncbi:MAG: bifunctional 5,10-methylene-tetrahydrofolate dehydrogenase/5,10-methylene-tetrahydrofolate cyclohydrolase [Lachnospiraceae bacterium]|nr:bifunctional 5,10-methylene-tetrahydrofolate dehydrogenase/5,10-methylene-tetrahydrofolate cyclohydrolase [Lachnospiraceae bacterium]